MVYWSEIFDEETISKNVKEVKELPTSIKKESEKYTNKWEKPAYETGKNSDGRTLETCLDELSKNWTTDNGLLVTEELKTINEEINATLQSMKKELLSISKITMNTSYKEDDEVIEL